VATPKPHSTTLGNPTWAALLAHSAMALALFLAIPVGMTRALAEGAADPAKVLERLRQRRKLREEQNQREFAKLIAQARALLAENQAEQAKRLLARAAQLRPDDETCTRLLAQAEAASGSPASTSEKLLDTLRAEQHSKNALLQVQLGASLFEAKKALKAGDHARAREHAERVLDGVAYVTDPDRAAKLRTGAEAVLAAARAAGDAARQAELKAVLGSQKAKAARDSQASISQLNRQGWEFLDRGDPQKALAVADKILRLEPGNPRGLYLRQEAARLADERGDRTALRQKRKDIAKKLLVDQLNEEMTVPSKEDRARIVMPAKKHKARNLAAPADRAHEPWEAQLRAKLKKPVEIQFRNTTIAEACRYLAQVADCPMVIDPAVAKNTRRLNLPTMTMSLEHALRWLCRFGKATYTLRDHAILVTTHGGMLEEPVTKSYDISALLIPARTVRTTFNGGTQTDDPHWAAKDLMAAAGNHAPGNAKPVAEDQAGESWVRFICSTVAPDTWEEPGKDAVLQAQQPYTISYRNGRIVVVHTPEVQEQIGRLLDDFRRARNLQVHIMARFLLLQTDFLDRFDLDMVGPDFDLGTDDLSLAPGTLTPAEVSDHYGFVSDPADPWQTGASPPKKSAIAYLYNDSRVSVGGEGELSASGPLEIRIRHIGSSTVNALLQAVAKRRKGTILSAPRLTCFNTQRANFQAITNYNYIRSINSDGEPEIGNVPDGIIFDVQPFVSTDRRFITLVLQPQMRTLRNRTTLQTGGFTYATGGGIIRNINLPDTELRSIATTVTIPDGGTMLVGGLATVRERTGEAGVPIINRMPLLRFLFREWTSYDSRQSLLVLVTAETVPDIFEE